MIIALDYDGTYTADKNLWNHFIMMARVKGHEVHIVTYREKEHDWNEDFTGLDALNVPLVFTKGIAKKFYCEHWGPKIDIWIDDNPKAIFENSTFPADKLKEWRDNNAKAASERPAV